MVALGLALVACTTPTPTPTKAPAAPPTATTVTNVVSCPATYPVPGAEFRSDDPKKLDAGNKPKLVEFFAYW
ncbi:MAG: hypothetical protein AB1817_11245 [Chloroflexota bacterium]